MSEHDQNRKPSTFRLPIETLREKSATAVKSLRQASEQAGGLAKTASQRLSEVGAPAWDYLRDRGRDGAEALLRASKDVRDALLPEKRVPVYLLPTGIGRTDFFCVIDFKEVVELLAGGRFARPCLEVWAARSDVHRLALATHLRDEFTSQLQAERERRRHAAETEALPQLDRLDTEKSKAGGLVEKATFALTSSLLFMFFIANPIFDLLFLVLAVFSGAGGVTKAFRYVQLTARIRGSQKDLEKQKKNLEGELDARNRDFLSAVENLEIRVHPVLERVLVHMSELDGKPFVPPEILEDDTDVPLLGEHLRLPRYRDGVPDAYHPLIDAEI